MSNKPDFKTDDVCSIAGLETESARWVAMGIIEPLQRGKILELYPSQTDQPSRFASIIALFGAICLGMGGILFVASNWQAIPSFLKTILMAGLASSSVWAGYHLGYKKGNYPKIGESLVLVGCILWGASIALVAQIYNIHSPHPTNGGILWLIGVLPLAWALMSPQVWALSSLGIILIAGFRQVEYMSSRWGNDGFFSASMAAALLIFALGCLGTSRLKTEAPARAGMVTGSFFILAYAYVSSFRGGSRMWTVADTANSNTSMILFLTIILLAGSFGIAQLLRGIRSKVSWEISEGAMITLISTATLFITSMGGLSDRTLAALIWNLLLVGAIGAVIHSGTNRAIPGLVNLGFIFFALFIFSRYFDFFFDLMDRSLFFIGAGALLIFGSAKIESRRKKMLASIGRN
ncbi:MAG: hypothetical protein CVV64_15495 [Candidatus Wallbacteria bacterium HGW-Wallbacteria-1]|jgi:uncharacterized membrane protein|uniref:DUF2157 domain-containing protein n=1 Tax=Candidatus Wallbacteria bacterium HGW-Wallbacteria-1 TaxID=2013854 RepID=A0A2N1PLJ5_9BACT|nr:MAG: hypothetical protein CVV64_15495 [Candidatus Wallbacteria bacterium HGW-Wallbacteria-1]